MKPRVKSENLVLGALMTGSMHGYEIMKFLKENLSFAWDLGTSQLYLLLGRLEKDSFIYGTKVNQETRPSKRVFSITEKGRNHFLKWLQSPSLHVRDIRLEFVTKLFFIKSLFPESGKLLLDNQQRTLLELKNEIMKIIQNENDPFRRLVYRYRYFLIKGTIRWLEKDVSGFIVDPDK